MSSKECYHFTYLSRAFSIKQGGLEPRLEENSKALKDNAPKVSFSEGKVGAIGLFSNFYRVYMDIKEGRREASRTDPAIAKKVMASKNFEEYMRKGMYLIFDGTDIENTGGNKGHINIFDAGTEKTILPESLEVGIITDTNTGKSSYSKFDYINYLMANISKEEILKLQNEIGLGDFEFYIKSHKDEIEKFKNSKYKADSISLEKFCDIYKSEIMSEQISLNNLLSKSLGEQVTAEMEDVLYTDETERDIATQQREIEYQKENSKNTPIL